jgi:hypothetical protein
VNNEYTRSCRAAQKATKRRRYNQALKNVISLRISDDELVQLTRIREATSKSFSEIMRDAFNVLQHQPCPCAQS